MLHKTDFEPVELSAVRMLGEFKLHYSHRHGFARLWKWTNNWRDAEHVGYFIKKQPGVWYYQPYIDVDLRYHSAPLVIVQDMARYLEART